jgi:hypothetical protein
MSNQGWKQLLEGFPWFLGKGRYPIAAYSEFMPPLRLGLKPYGITTTEQFREEDPFGWVVNEYEEMFEVRSGLEHIGMSQT